MLEIPVWCLRISHVILSYKPDDKGKIVPVLN
jgi:hypothetical protein